MPTWFSRTHKSGKVSWYTKDTDAHGEWKPVLLKGCKSEPHAKRLAFEIEAQRERRKLGLPATTAAFTGTFAELCAWAHENHLSLRASSQPDGSVLRKHAGDPEKGTATWLGALPVRHVTAAQLARYFTELSKTVTVRGKPYSGGSINRIRALFATVFELAKEEGYWVGDNPVHGTKERPHVPPNHDILMGHEVKPTLDCTPGHWRGCLAVGIYAALRKGEIFGAMKADVDLERRVMMIRRSHDRETTKGNKKHAVPIHEDLVPYLEEWLQTPGPWLFPDRDGNQRSRHADLPRVLQQAMVRAGFIDRWEMKCRRSGCGHVHDEPHPGSEPAPQDCPACGFRLWATPRARHIKWHEGTRHTSASHMLMNGASLAAVQNILRHSDPRLTIKTYGHLTAGYLNDEVNRVSFTPLAADGDAVAEFADGEPPTAPVHTQPTTRGALVVRGAKKAIKSGVSKVMNQHQNRLTSSWSRGVSNPRPMHCEGIRGVSPVAAPTCQPCQVSETSDGAQTPDCHPLSTRDSNSGARGAPVVRGKGSTHHESRTAKGGGYSPEIAPDPADLATVQQVADQLQVGRTWVRRRLESGDLTGIRLAPAAPLMISRRQLAAYLERFPGIAAPARPEPADVPAVPASRARKGAA